MRRRVTLYLGGLRADLADDGFVLLNYAMTDLTNPAVVRNSWTQEIDLPRTADNDHIFGGSYRLDRVPGTGGTGPDFNAGRRLPFAIYTDAGEVLFSGYAKLNTITKDAYKVTLYGGLGEFLYNLSYDSNGEQKTLASLDYGQDLDFTITAQAVRDAWDRLAGDTSKPAKWDIINFAPCYNGIPENFKADKAVGNPADFGLSTIISGHTPKAGYALFNLTEDRDEWQVKDLRSYLQRPVLSTAALLDAICNPANNGGWSVDASDVTGTLAFNTWLTRPLLPSLGTYVQTEGDIGVAFQQVSLGKVVAQFNCTDIPAGSQVTAHLSFDLGYTCAAAGTMKSWKPVTIQGVMPGYAQQVLFVQAVAYASDNTMVAAGPVKTICKSYDKIQPSILAGACGYTPRMGASFLPGETDTYYSPDNGKKVRTAPITCEVAGVDIDYIQIEVTAYRALISDAGSVSNITGGTSAIAALWDASDNEETPSASGAVSGSGTATAQSGDSLRSGAYITKEMLLSTSKTPAEYLLALCKMEGMFIVADQQTKSVQILTRATFFSGNVNNLEGRVDKDSIQIQPMYYDAKWYELRQESVGGAFETEYLQTEGVQYGIQRIDTGFDFDAEAKDIFAGMVLRSCAEVQDRGAWWYVVTDNGDLNPFLEPGNTYTMWDTDGEDLETGIYTPGVYAVSTPINSDFPGYDLTSRAEFRDGENKGVDGSDVLLMLLGLGLGANMPQFHLSDDLAVMDQVAGGPCWLIGDYPAGEDIPSFGRLRCLVDMGTGRAYVQTSLDMGVPRKMDIPELDYSASSTLYANYWEAWFDNLAGAKVMRCKVLWENVGAHLFRDYYYYGGAVWMLSKVSNYSLTTFDLAECEFVQVY